MMKIAVLLDPFPMLICVYCTLSILWLGGSTDHYIFCYNFHTSDDQIANDRRSMKHDEVVIARRTVEEGHGLVVIVNKMDLLRGKQNSSISEKVMEAVPQEIQTIIPQVCQFMIKLHNCIALGPCYYFFHTYASFLFEFYFQVRLATCSII